MSLLNGLSAMSQSTAAFASTAGLAAQKAQLAAQNLALADQLATVRETAGRVQAGDIAAKAADVQNTFQGGQNAAQRTTQLQVAGTQAGAEIGAANIGAGATVASEKIRAASAAQTTQMQIDAPTPQMKLYHALGVPLVDYPSPASVANAANAPATSGATSTQSSSSPSSGTSAGSSTPSPSASTAPTWSSLSSNPLVAHAAGLPMPGTPEAIHLGIAQGVSSDPVWKNAPPAAQAMETAKRILVADGKIADPDTREAMANAIASYQMSPLTGNAMRNPSGAAIMARVTELNPDYQATLFNEKNANETYFGPGKGGQKVEAISAATQHMSVMANAAVGLQNGAVAPWNAFINTFHSQVGFTSPRAFDALKQVVGTEIEKAVAGGIGASGDRDRLMASLDDANSPAQLVSVLNGFRDLMNGQLSALKTQYESSGGFKTGPFDFNSKLSPATMKALEPQSGASATQAPAAPAIPSWVKPGDQYSPSRGLARGADGTTYGQPTTNQPMFGR